MVVTQRYANVTDWLHAIETEEQPEPKTMRMSDPSNPRSETPEWFGTRSIEEAITLCRTGWPEGLERVQKMSARISDDLVKKLYIPEVRFDVTGDQLDVGRFVNGEPEDFMVLDMAEVEQQPKIIRIVISMFLSAGVSQEALFGKGAAICALVDALEKHGKRVIIDTVYGLTGTRRGADVTRTWIRIKEADAPVQLANLVFVLAHTSMIRRLLFHTIELLPHKTRASIGADNRYYGAVSELTADEDRGDIYIGATDLHRFRHSSEQDSQRWVVEKLSKQGIYVQKEEAV